MPRYAAQTAGSAPLPLEGWSFWAGPSTVPASARWRWLQRAELGVDLGKRLTKFVLLLAAVGTAASCGTSVPDSIVHTRAVILSVLGPIKSSTDLSEIRQSAIDAVCAKVTGASLTEAMSGGSFDGVSVSSDQVPGGTNYFFTKNLDFIGSSRAVMGLSIGKSGQCWGSLSWSSL